MTTVTIITVLAFQVLLREVVNENAVVYVKGHVAHNVIT